MEELHRAADKFEHQADILTRIIERMSDDPDPRHIDIALGAAKRVRRESTLLVRHLASLRDQLQP